MALLDRFKKKLEKKNQKTENVLDMVQEPTTPSASTTTIAKDDTGRAYRILSHHHLSEKTNQFSTSGSYVFKVNRNVNKIEVKNAIEAVYNVHVVSVNMINVTGKKRRYGRTTGTTSDWKKAVVKLKSGEKISGLAEGV